MCVVILLLILVCAFLLLSRRIAQSQTRHVALEQQLRKELHLLASGVAGMGQHLANLEKQFSSLLVKQDELVQQQTILSEHEDGTHYPEAARLIAKGATVEEVMQICSISRAEAELLKRLHQPNDDDTFSVETIVARANKIAGKRPRKKDS
jgi:hypothetical protein